MCIASITVREYWPNFNMLKVGYADGTEQVITEYYPSGNERTLSIPDGFSVAGFYGRNEVGYFIRSLGFILMQNISPVDSIERQREAETSFGD